MPSKRSRNSDVVVIRSWPKVIFLYPVMLTCFVCGIWQLFVTETDAATREVAGLIFFLVLALNILVVAFEFGRFRTISLVFFFVALIFMLLYLSEDWPVISWIQSALGGMKIRMSTSFYFAFGVYLLVIFVGVYINSRFNYWVVKRNEILHKEGFLGDVRRFPSPNLKMTKEIPDVFEFLLLGAGKMVLYPASEKQAIVLDHVLRVNASERAIQDLLSSLSVEIRSDDDDGTPMGIGD